MRPHEMSVNVDIIFYPMPESVVAWVLSGMGKYSDVFIRFTGEEMNAGISEEHGAYIEKDVIHDTNFYRKDCMCDTVSIKMSHAQAERIKSYFSSLVGKRVRYSCTRTTLGYDPFLWFCCFCVSGTSLTAPEVVAGALLWGGVFSEKQCPTPHAINSTELHAILSNNPR